MKTFFAIRTSTSQAGIDAAVQTHDTYGGIHFSHGEFVKFHFPDGKQETRQVFLKKTKSGTKAWIRVYHNGVKIRLYLRNSGLHVVVD